jgi:hypothetical protein
VSPVVASAGSCIADHMDEILKMFKPGAKIAVCVWVDGKPDRDLFITNGEADEVIEVARRSKDRDEHMVV